MTAFETTTCAWFVLTFCPTIAVEHNVYPAIRVLDPGYPDPPTPNSDHQMTARSSRVAHLYVSPHPPAAATRSCVRSRSGPREANFAALTFHSFLRSSA